MSDDHVRSLNRKHPGKKFLKSRSKQLNQLAVEVPVILVGLLTTFFRLNLFKSWRNFQIKGLVSRADDQRLKLKLLSKIMFVLFIHMRSIIDAFFLGTKYNPEGHR